MTEVKLSGTQEIIKPEVTIGHAKGASAHGWHRINSYLECPFKYQQEQVRGIKVPRDQTPAPFTVGLIHHALRARWFANRFSTAPDNWPSLLAAMEQARLDASEPMDEEHIREGLNLFEFYMGHCAKLPHPDPVAAEYLVQSKLNPSDPDELVFSARLDDVSRYPEAQGKLCLGESKTTSDIAGTINEYTLHGQPMLQAALWEVAPQGAQLHGSVAGVMLDIVRKPYGKVPAKCVRQFMPLNRDALLWFVDDLREQKAKALQITWDSKVQRNITSCTRMYGRMRIECPYRQMCMYGRTAAGNYVLPDGSALNEWTPSEGRTVEPWK